MDVFGGPSKGLHVQVGSKIPVARRAPCKHTEGHLPFLKLVQVEGTTNCVTHHP